MNDPVKVIKQDHRRVKTLFRDFDRARGRAEQQKIARKIIEELSVHATIEEQLVYPVLRERENRMEPQVLNALEEHHAAKLVLAELDDMNADEERFKAKMHVARSTVETHMAEEEAQLLPKLAKLLDAEQRSRIGAAMERLRQSAPKHPHPSAPDTPPAGAIAAMLAKFTDAGMDFVRKITSELRAGQRRVTAPVRATARKALAMGGNSRGNARGRSPKRAAARRRGARPALPART